MEEIRKIIMTTSDASGENPENDTQQFAVCTVCGEPLEVVSGREMQVDYLDID